jgi:hypothetical protein
MQDVWSLTLLLSNSQVILLLSHMHARAVTLMYCAWLRGKWRLLWTQIVHYTTIISRRIRVRLKSIATFVNLVYQRNFRIKYSCTMKLYWLPKYDTGQLWCIMYISSSVVFLLCRETKVQRLTRRTPRNTPCKRIHHLQIVYKGRRTCTIITRLHISIFLLV